MKFSPWISLGLVMMAWLAQPSVLGCATCFGASDEPMAKGMNMGILALLVVLTMVLTGIVSFAVFVAKRTAALAAPEAQAQTAKEMEMI
jgi:uncharacterized membrane protein